MLIEPSEIEVCEESLPDIFPEEWVYRGSRSVASTNRDELLGLAKKVCEDDKDSFKLDAVALLDVREIKVKGMEKTCVYYGVAEGYSIRYRFEKEEGLV